MSHNIARSVSFVVLLLAASGGCKPQEPVYSTDKDLGQAGQPLLPNDQFLAYDARLTQGTVQDPDVSHLAPKSDKPARTKGRGAASQDDGAEGEPAEPSGDGEPDAADDGGDAAGAEVDPEILELVQTHNQLIKQKKYDEAVQLYVEPYRENAAMSFRVMDKVLRIADLVGETMPPAAEMKKQIEAALNQKLVATQPDGEDRIIGSLAMTLPGAAAMPPTKHVFERVDGGWRFAHQQGLGQDRLPALNEIGKEAETKLDTLLAGLEDGSVAPQVALGPLVQALMTMQSKVMQLMQAGSQPVAPTQPKLPAEPTDGDDGQALPPRDEDDPDEKPRAGETGKAPNAGEDAGDADKRDSGEEEEEEAEAEEEPKADDEGED